MEMSARASTSLSDASPRAAHNHVNKEVMYPSRGRNGPATASSNEFRSAAAAPSAARSARPHAMSTNSPT
eukprot:1859858-Pyramimonas_sp.AAC.1